MAIFGIRALIQRAARGAAARHVKGTGKPLVSGFPEAIARLVGFGAIVDESWENACEELADEILLDAIKRAPLETGKLRDSGKVTKKGRGTKAVYSVGFGAPYAMYVHEQVEMRLKGMPRRGAGRTGFYWDPQGEAEAEFLLKAFKANKSKLRERVAFKLSNRR